MLRRERDPVDDRVELASAQSRRNRRRVPDVALQDRGLAEVPSTRLLIAAARIIASGVEERDACYAAVVSPLSDDATLVGAMRDLVDATFV